MSPTTLYLSQLFGPILFITGLSVLINQDEYKKMMVKEFKEFTLSYHIAAIAALSVGIAVVLSHNLWNTLPEILVSLIGWGALLKGIIRLLSPETSMQLIPKVAKCEYFTPMILVIIAWGGYMSWIGYLA